MDEASLRDKERELRGKHPEFFAHPDLRSGEILISSQVGEVVYRHADIYRQHGVVSARVGEHPVASVRNKEAEVFFYPIFADLKELLKAVECYDHATK